ncbi:hypothetical protein E2C01_081376 [Portunus trituberculatus]|uniref:Uncharacterized protein n=1 Tax=Portunus trituberculatus TaxID=210409 RepID=A0A5B7IVP1_PORTR|nr:hypothetical protein [Portunus trituberculatus]
MPAAASSCMFDMARGRVSLASPSPALTLRGEDEESEEREAKFLLLVSRSFTVSLLTPLLTETVCASLPAGLLIRTLPVAVETKSSVS